MRNWQIEVKVFNGRYYKTAQTRVQASTLRTALSKAGGEIRKLFPRLRIEEVIVKVRPL